MERFAAKLNDGRQLFVMRESARSLNFGVFFPKPLKMNPEELSGKLLLAVRLGEPTEEWLRQLAHLPTVEIEEYLHNDDLKKAFWINVYNAGFQILRSVYGLQGKQVYRIRRINVGGQLYSLDDIEHGILRKYRCKFSLGYLPQLFVAHHIRKMALRKLDFRIHFALNCGARSCPPIAFYSAGKIDQQLDWATHSFLESETQFDQEKRLIRTTRLFQWYRGDFGGVRGVRRILAQYLQMPTAGFRVVYNDYSWEEQLANFVEEEGG
jgi:hypothetical protein